MGNLPGKREQKDKARAMLMHGIGNVLGYWTERDPNPFAKHTDTDDNPAAPDRLTEADKDEFGAVLQREADRIARLLGYESAWTN